MAARPGGLLAEVTAAGSALCDFVGPALGTTSSGRADLLGERPQAATGELGPVQRQAGGVALLARRDDRQDAPAGGLALDPLLARRPPPSLAPPTAPAEGSQRSPINVQRIGIPDLGDILEQVPGYDILKLVIGFDPATGSAVTVTPSSLVRAVMGLAPGGRNVHDRLVELHVLQDVYELINAQLTAHNLTVARFRREAEQAWEEVDLTPSLSIVSDAIAVVARHINAILRDVRALASSVVDQIIRIVREAAIKQAERLLAQSEEARKIWDLARAVIKYDPLRGEAVQATTEDIIAKFLTLIGRDRELEQMRARGTLAQTAAWVDQQIAQFMGIIGEFQALVSAALDALTFENLPNLPSNLMDLAQRGLALIRRVASFAGTVAGKVLELIKDSLLGMLDEHAQRIPGFHLVTVLLGRNPLTNARVPRTATNIIKGFITLMPDGEAQFEQLQQTGVIPQAAARIEAAIERLGISWDFIVGLFTDIWNSFTIDDLIDPIAAFQRVVERFAEPISRLFSFISTVVEEVFTLVLRLMGFPSDLLERIIANAVAAFDRIAADPVGFFNNLLAALKLGFTKFFDNIGTHLLSGLAGWLLRGLRDAGIQMPAEITLQSILDVVLQVLGITVEKVWQKLAEKIGPERVAMIRRNIDRLTGIWTFVKDVQERGIIAIWEYIRGQVSNLWNMILDRAKNWILTELVQAAVQKILSMLDPTGIMAVVNSFLAFFRAVQSVIRYMRDILQIVDRYVATLASIAAGQIQPGAAQLEGGLAASVPVAIGFLANQVGLGNVGDKIREFIQAGAAMVDQAISWLIDKALQLGGSLLAALGLGEQSRPQAQPASPGARTPGLKVEFDATGKHHEMSLTTDGRVVVASGEDKPLATDHHVGAMQQAQAEGRQNEYPSIEELARRRVALEAKAREVSSREGAGLNANDPQNQALLQGLQRLAEMVRATWSAIHYTGELSQNTASRPGLGTVEPHATNTGLQQNQDKDEREKLTSEHVIPRAWISRAFESQFQARAITDSQYNRMFTINIYTGAARLKTNNEGEGDNTAIREIMAYIAQTQEPTGFIVGRVDLTMRAIHDDHVRQPPRTGDPKPDRAAVSNAAGRQMEQTLVFLRENMPSVGGVEAGAPLEMVQAQQLAAQKPLSGTQLGVASGLLGALTRWINRNGGSASPGLRQQVHSAWSALSDAVEESRPDGSVYDGAYRSLVVGAYQQRSSITDQQTRATQAAQEVPIPSTATIRPKWTRVVEWVREAGV